MKTPLIVLIASASLLIGCTQKTPQHPADTFYRSYIASAKSGHNYDQDKTFWTSAKLAEADEMIQNFIEGSGKTKKEIIDIYMKTSFKMATCLDLTLESTDVSSNSVELKYKATDSCSGNQTLNQRVIVVDEDGWKLSEVETFI